MKLKNWLKKWNLETLKINAEFLEVELKFNDVDKLAAWELYVEMLTRITTQRLDNDHGDEKTALDSVYSLFKTTREILKKQGPKCIKFARIAIVVLNQIVRPFTAKWHKESIAGAFKNEYSCRAFRTDLAILQARLKDYTHLLSEIAGVEDLTNLETID